MTFIAFSVVLFMFGGFTTTVGVALFGERRDYVDMFGGAVLAFVGMAMVVWSMFIVLTTTGIHV